MLPRELVVVVHGTPAPQGSKRHVGRGVLVESSPNLRPWRAVVTAAAADAVEAASWAPDRRAVCTLYGVWTLARPTSHYRTGKHADQLRDAAPAHPGTRPDLDKLLRSTLDALVDAGALVDDARVVTVHAVKAYPGGHLDALDGPGAVLHLREAVTS